MQPLTQRLGYRAIRVATGTALSLVISFGLDFPIPVVAPVFTVFCWARRAVRCR